MLENLIIIIHLLAAVAVVGLILIQQGKGAEMGASFGSGASQTVFGVQGSGNLLTHSTAILVAVFFATSLSLAHFAKQKTAVDVDDVIIEDVAAEQPAVAPADAASEVPAAPAVEAPAAEAPAAAAPVSASADAPLDQEPAKPTASEEIPE